MNTALRGHLTRVKFQLTLRESHLVALTRFASRAAWNPSTEHQHWSFYSHNDHAGVSGLIERGLVRPVDSGPVPFVLTPAGDAVMVLLKESGLLESYGMVVPAEAR